MTKWSEDQTVRGHQPVTLLRKRRTICLASGSPWAMVAQERLHSAAWHSEFEAVKQRAQQWRRVFPAPYKARRDAGM